MSLLILCLLLSGGCVGPHRATGTIAADGAVTLAFVGDILPGGNLAWAVKKYGHGWPWVHAGPVLREADVAFGNLETAVSRRGAPVPAKQFTFRTAPYALHGLADAGLDVLTLANNHSLDFGPDALLDTIRNVRETGMAPVGAGANAAAAGKPLMLDAHGLRLAVLAFSRVIPEVGWIAGESRPGVAPGWDAKPTVEAVRSAKAQADIVVVLVHWGEEVQSEPRASDVDLARQLVAAGATVVAGHHPHVLQAMERQDRSLIAYSLGNFVFPPVARPVNQETGILEVTVNREGVQTARFRPMVIVGGQPRQADQRTAGRILGRLDQLSARRQTRIAPDGMITKGAAH